MKLTATSRPRTPGRDVPLLWPVRNPTPLQLELEDRIGRLLFLIDEIEGTSLKARAKDKLWRLVADLQQEYDRNYGLPFRCPWCDGTEPTYQAYLRGERVRNCAKHNLDVIRIYAVFNKQNAERAATPTNSPS